MSNDKKHCEAHACDAGKIWSDYQKGCVDPIPVPDCSGHGTWHNHYTVCRCDPGYELDGDEECTKVFVGYVNRETHMCVAITSEDNGCGAMIGNDVEGDNKGDCISEEACSEIGFVDTDNDKCVTAKGCGEKVGDLIDNSATNGECISKDECMGYVTEENTCVEAEYCGEGMVGSDLEGETKHTCISKDACVGESHNGYVDTAAHKCVAKGKCGKGLYTNNKSECVPAKECGTGFVGDEVAGSKTFGTCISEGECRHVTSTDDEYNYVDEAAYKCVAQGECQTPDTFTRENGRKCVAAEACGTDMLGDIVESSETKGQCVEEAKCREQEDRFADLVHMKCAPINATVNECGPHMVGDEVAGSETLGKCISEDKCREIGYVSIKGDKCVSADKCGDNMVGDDVAVSETKGLCIAIALCKEGNYEDAEAHKCVAKGKCETEGYYTRDDHTCVPADKCGENMVGDDMTDLHHCIAVSECVEEPHNGYIDETAHRCTCDLTKYYLHADGACNILPCDGVNDYFLGDTNECVATCSGEWALSIANQYTCQTVQQCESTKNAQLIKGENQNVCECKEKYVWKGDKCGAKVNTSAAVSIPIACVVAIVIVVVIILCLKKKGKSPKSASAMSSSHAEQGEPMDAAEEAGENEQ